MKLLEIRGQEQTDQNLQLYIFFTLENVQLHFIWYH